MTRVTIGRWVLGLMGVAMSACGSSHAAEEHPASEHASGGTEHTASPTVELHNACVLMMHREGQCTDQFIPALVALRVRLDHPAGIAARDAADHDALVTQAIQEYAHDATEERIAATCHETSELPADRTTGWTAQINDCLALTDCQAFVDCDMRFTEARFRDRMQHDAADAGTP